MTRRSTLFLVLLALCAVLGAAPGGVPTAAGESTAPAPGLVPSAAAASPPLVLRLRLETDAPGRFVHLRDVVEVGCDRDGVFDSVASTVVRVRDGRFVRRVDVVRRLVRAGLAEGSFRVTGPALCDWRPRNAGAAVEEAVR
jgi:hypothetical protein